MNVNYETIPCNLCGKNDTLQLAQKGQFNLPARVVLCRNCGLAYLNPRWTKETYLDFYTNHYDKYYRPNISKISIKENEPNPIYERLSKDACLPVSPKNILDIGSGSGLNLAYFKLKFPDSNYYAIEPSDAAASILHNNGISLISRDVDDDWHKNVQRKFDLIIMRHVLEHFSDPVAALAKIESTLSDSGIIYIAVPNSFNPLSPLLTSWFRVVHTYYFNRKTLKGILQKSNLQLITAVEGDHFNKGELYAYARKGNGIQEIQIDPATFQEQLMVFQTCLGKERQWMPTIKRQIKFFNQWLQR
jgi:SAM-dependent methyltransferase